MGLARGRSRGGRAWGRRGETLNGRGKTYYYYEGGLVIPLDGAIHLARLQDLASKKSLGHLPLFWNERKSRGTWKLLLTDLQIESVYDLTPGSGTLARAAMESGIAYVGVASNPAHAAWLNNVLDRAALGAVTTSGAPMHDTDLAKMIEVHYKDELAQLGEMDAAEDDDEISDAECAVR